MLIAVVVIILIAAAYIAAVALWVAYAVLFAPPRFAPADPDPAGGSERRAEEYLARQKHVRRPRRRDSADPVCGRAASLKGLYTWPFRGRVYYFCSDSCQRRFARNPDAYVLASGKPRPVFDHFCKPR